MLTDIWSSIKARSVAGDLMDAVRSGGLTQGIRKFTSPSSGPVFSLSAFPKLARSRSDWLSGAPRGEAAPSEKMGTPTPGLIIFKVRSFLGRTDVISGHTVAVPSRAIVPGTNIDGKRVRVM